MPRSALSIDRRALMLLVIWPLGLAASRCPLHAQQGSVADTQARQKQQDPAQEPIYSIKVRSQLVQVDVVVRNGKGELVRGLGRDNFLVSEDGVPVRVSSFEATTPPPKTNLARSAVNSTAELDRREPNAPVTLIVLDELTSRFEDQYFARYSMEKYLSTQGDVLDQPMTLIARTPERTIVLCDYTSSKARILDALHRHLANNDWRLNNPNFVDIQAGAAFASLLEIAKATQGHAGHKNLVWIGRGFPTLQWQDLPDSVVTQLKTAVSNCVNLLRESRVTLYVIDPAGVQGPSGRSDENGIVTLDDPFDEAVSFDSLARATGGTSLHGRNDVDHLIGTAVENGETFYTLAYRPSSSADADSMKFRKIKVTLTDPTLIATNREGYYTVPSERAAAAATDAKGKMSQATSFDLAAASTGLMVFDGVPLTLMKQDSPKSEIQVNFPVSAIGLNLTDQKLRGDVTLVVLCFDRSGKVLAKDGRVVSLHLSPQASGQAEDRTVHLTSALNPQLPVARVRVVVRSNTNGKVGAENLILTESKR